MGVFVQTYIPVCGSDLACCPRTRGARLPAPPARNRKRAHSTPRPSPRNVRGEHTAMCECKGHRVNIRPAYGAKRIFGERGGDSSWFSDLPDACPPDSRKQRINFLGCSFIPPTCSFVFREKRAAQRKDKFKRKQAGEEHGQQQQRGAPARERGSRAKQFRALHE